MTMLVQGQQLRRVSADMSGRVLALVLLIFIFSDNPIGQSAPIKFIPLFAVFSFLLLPLRAQSVIRSVGSTGLLLAASYFATCSLSAYASSTPTPLVFGLILIVGLAVAYSQSEAELRRVVAAVERVLLVSAVVAAISIVFQKLFGLGTFFIGDTPAVLGTFIAFTESGIPRAAGFFFEPGQFSFYICLCVACRYYLGMRGQRDFVLLALGLLTQSLAHLIFAVLFSCVLIGFVAYFAGLFDWAIPRGKGMIDEPESWARYVSLLSAFELFDGSWRALVFGPVAEFVSRSEVPEFLGENPIAPLLYGGLSFAWPYYFFLIVAAVLPVLRGANALILFAIGLLLLQRPYLTDFPYFLIIGILMKCYALSQARSNPLAMTLRGRQGAHRRQAGARRLRPSAR
jgi:hypothetical protein